MADSPATKRNVRFITSVYMGCAVCLGLIVLGGTLLLGGIFLYDHLDKSDTKEYLQSLEDKIAAAVPPGSDQLTAKSWLTSQGMDVSEWGPDLKDTGVEGHGIPPDLLSGIIRGNTSRESFFGDDDISVYFLLDKEGKVIKHRIFRFRPSL